jgi:anti-anti-sigma factor
MADFHVEQLGDRLVLFGELDHESSLLLAKAFDALDTPPAVLDLGNITFVDSIGLRRLILLKRKLPRLELVNATPGLRRLLAVSGLQDVLFA